MRQAGVLTAILPESEKWGIDSIHGLVRTEGDLGWPVDALLRLESMIPPDTARVDTMGKRLKMSNAERARLEAWARTDVIKPEMSEQALKNSSIAAANKLFWIAFSSATLTHAMKRLAVMRR